MRDLRILRFLNICYFQVLGKILFPFRKSQIMTKSYIFFRIFTYLKNSPITTGIGELSSNLAKKAEKSDERF